MIVLLQSQVQKVYMAHLTIYLLIASIATPLTTIMLYFDKQTSSKHKPMVLLIGFSIAAIVISGTIVIWKKSKKNVKVVKQGADIILEIDCIAPLTIHEYRHGQIKIGNIRELVVGIYDQQGALIFRLKAMYGKMYSVPSHWTPNNVPAGKAQYEYATKGKFLIELIDAIHANSNNTVS